MTTRASTTRKAPTQPRRRKPAASKASPKVCTERNDYGGSCTLPAGHADDHVTASASSWSTAAAEDVEGE